MFPVHSTYLEEFASEGPVAVPCAFFIPYHYPWMDQDEGHFILDSRYREMTAPAGYRVFHGLAMLFVATMLVSNTVAVKIIDLGGLQMPAGIICFPIAYIFNDVFVEVYGYEKTRSVIWFGFACLAFMAGMYFLATLLPPAPIWQDEEAFGRLFGMTPRIAMASFVGYLVGSFLNAFVMSRMKVLTHGRHLWSRIIGSTIVGEAGDSILFNIVAFSGIFDFRQILFLGCSSFLLKTLYEVVATPLTYLVANWLKRVEMTDKYDHGVSYNPFRL